jgi:hypothetical protein
MRIRADNYTYTYSLSYPANAYGWERHIAALDDGIQFIANEVGATPILLLIPTAEVTYAQYLTEALSTENLSQMTGNYQMMLDLCAERGWLCIDPLPAFRAAIAGGETVYYAYDMHLDASGNRILAQIVADYLRENGLLQE